MENKKVSLKDVAQHIGVSAALVSYVLNGKAKEARVSEEMVKKILEVAQQMNYRPNLIAKSLKLGKTNTIGLILADISNPFFSSIARIIEDEAQKNGYVVIFGSSDESSEKQQQLIDVFMTRLVDAFIIAPTAGTQEQINTIVSKGVPIVLIDRFFPNVNVDCVHLNNMDAANLAVDKLIKNGRSRIGMIAYKTDQTHMNDRINGYKNALKKEGIRFSKDWLVEPRYTNIAEDVTNALASLFKPLKVDALFFATNSLAVIGLKEIVKLGIRIPDELAIISFDESEAFDFFYSPITCVSQSLVDMGKESIRLVIERLQGAKRSTSEVTIEGQLVIRKSCGS